jgi:putative oxidoreductase
MRPHGRKRKGLSATPPPTVGAPRRKQAESRADAGALGATRFRAWSPYLLSVLRIVAAFLFFQYGSAKLLAFPAAVMPGGGTAPLASLPGVAGALELVGGVLLFFGLLTRPVAFMLSGEMAVAYFMGHASKGFWPVLNGGAPAVFFCFLWLYIASAGPGPWSVDARWRRGAG